QLLPAAAPLAAVAFSTYFTAFASGASTDRSGADAASVVRNAPAAMGATEAPSASRRNSRRRDSEIFSLMRRSLHQHASSVADRCAGGAGSGVCSTAAGSAPAPALSARGLGERLHHEPGTATRDVRHHGGAPVQLGDPAEVDGEGEHNVLTLPQ